MCSLNDNIRVVTPIPDKNFRTRWAIKELNEKQFEIIEAPYSGDIHQNFRKFLWYLGLSKKTSLTEQLISVSNSEDQSKLWNKFKRKLPYWLLFRYEEFFGIPDAEITWYKSALRIAEIEIKKKKPNFIISSSPFMTSHLVASKLIKKHHIPWLADFRDTWSNNPRYPYSNLRRMLDKYIEKKIIIRSSLITTVSETYHKNLKKLHNTKIKVLPNGYTVLSLRKSRIVNPSVLNIVYTGTIYEGSQNFIVFLKGVKKAIDMKLIDKKRLKIDFYGPYVLALHEEVKNHDLSMCVFQNDIVSREKAFNVQQNADLLLFFNWESVEGGLSHLKLYEYFGSMKPILAVGSRVDSLNQQLIEATRTGFISIGADNICKTLTELYKKHIYDEGIPYNPVMNEIEKKSYYERGKALRNLLISI